MLSISTFLWREDARFVMEKMALNYPTLKAKGLPEKYKVRGFPTLLIIYHRSAWRRARHPRGLFTAPARQRGGGSGKIAQGEGKFRRKIEGKERL